MIRIWTVLAVRLRAHRRLCLWIAISAILAAVVTFKEIDTFLRAIEDPGRPSYGTSVFTGPTLRFWDTNDLSDAIRVWASGGTSDQQQSPAQGRNVAHALISWHVWIDFVFIFVYGALLTFLLQHVGARLRFAALAVIGLMAVDLVETALTYYVLALHSDPSESGLLLTLQALSLAKWLTLSCILVVTLVAWFKRDVGETTAARVWAHVRDAYDGTRYAPGLMLAGVIIVVVTFVGVVSLPAGGPLDQLPDVLRLALEPASSPTRILWTLASLLVFVGAVATAARTATAPTSAPPLPSGVVGAGAVALSLLLAIIAWVLERPLTAETLLPAAAPAIVVISLVSVARLVEWAGLELPAPSHTPRAWLVATTVESVSRMRWVGGVAALPLVGAGLGLIRAGFGPMILESSQTSAARWGGVTLAGLCMVLFSGYLLQSVIMRWGVLPVSPAVRRRLRSAVVVVTLLASFVLMRWPHLAEYPGTVGTVAVGLSPLVLVLGWLSYASRAHRWSATRTLRLGAATPWVAVVATTWLLASILNTQGVYHDARVEPARVKGAHTGAAAPRTALTDDRPSLREKFAAWRALQLDAPCGASADGSVPMILVASPGGGIRAAYWTATSLDTLFGAMSGRCAARRLFAVSGVSGGSVGAAFWLGSRAAGREGRSDVEALAADRALAASVAALLLRDIYQPLTAISGRWRSRAAVLEDGWLASASALSRDNASAGGDVPPAASGILWRELGAGLPWVPALVLNGSSVSDGCGVLISNVGGLAASTTSQCLAADTATGRPVAATIDAVGQLALRGDGGSCEAAEMMAVTGALLSARFPLVSTSGAIHRCVESQQGSTAGPSTSYVVDGGYFDNSGLSTLLELWSALRPLVEEHNRSREFGYQIQPWILVLDNSYRSVADSGKTERPHEVLVPLRTLANNRLFKQSAFEQRAAIALEGLGGRQHVVVVSPTVRPVVAAPLGWVLSAGTRKELCTQLDEAADQPSVRQLSEALGIPTGRGRVLSAHCGAYGGDQ